MKNLRLRKEVELEFQPRSECNSELLNSSSPWCSLYDGGQDRGRGQGIEVETQLFVVGTCCLWSFSVPIHPLHILLPVAASTGTAFDAPRQTLANKIELFLQKQATPLHHYRASVDPQISFPANHTCTRQLWYTISEHIFSWFPWRQFTKFIGRHIYSRWHTDWFFVLHFLSLLIHCVLCLNHLAFPSQLSWMGEIQASWLLLGTWQICLMRRMIGALWDQETSKPEALEEGDNLTFGSKLLLDIEFISPNAIVCWWEENYTGSPRFVAIRVNSPVAGWDLQSFIWF